LVIAPCGNTHANPARQTTSFDFFEREALEVDASLQQSGKTKTTLGTAIVGTQNAAGIERI
jgi:hypothetical protein